MIAAVLLVLGAVELGLRVSEDKLSLDVKHLQAIPSIVARLSREPSPRVLFLGNSLTRASISIPAVGEAWADPPSMARIHPDDTTLLDWHYIYQRYLEGVTPQPELIAVSFALTQLDDNQELHAARLGSHFAGFGFVREAFTHDVLETGDRAEFLLASAFRLMAYRERVQARVLAAIPGYKQLARDVNRGVRAKPATGLRAAKAYSRLRRFLEAVRGHGARAVFIAIPLPGAYTIPEELRTAVREGGAALIDMQGVEPLSRPDFPDGYHLSPEASVRFSRALGRELAASAFVAEALGRGGHTR